MFSFSTDILQLY